MAKSNKPARHAAHLRRGDKSLADVRRYADELRGRAAELSALAQAMQESGLEKVHLDGVTKLDRALPEIDSFLTYLETAIGEAKREKRRSEWGRASS
jgi:hypothetical protein